MTRIDKISNIRGLAVFRDFAWPDDLPTFGRFNLIYGWNGTGKTIISRIFRALELKKAIIEGDVTLLVEGRHVRADDFPHESLPIKVFNRDFVMESVFPFSGGEVPPIFVLGKEEVDKQKEVEKLKSDLDKAHAILEAAKSGKQAAEKDLDKFCIDSAKLIKDTLRSSGENPYNNYDKSNFRQRAELMANKDDRNAFQLSESDREKLLAQHRATPKPKLQMISYRLPELRPINDSVSQLLAETVVSAVIQSLRDDHVLAQWVYKGLVLHRERAAEKCLFCEQTLSKERLETLQAHFNAEYEKFLKKLEDYISKLRELAVAAELLKLPNRAELYEDLAAEYEEAERLLRIAVNSTRTFLASLIERLEVKKNQTFKSLALNIGMPEVDAGSVDRLNEIIRKHNQACDDFDRLIGEARQRLEADIVSRKLDDFLKLKQEIEAHENSLRQAEAEVKGVKEKIADLEREIVEHRRPAEELNEDLMKYLGHRELRLEIKQTGYVIARNGIPAEVLSEGEMTAIALLYFLKSLQDRRFDLKNGIIALDDPVSSLDANALYLAFGFIRERTHNAAQLFIFTHNFAFFRQVRNWFHNLPGQRKRDVNRRPARFYMLDCAYNKGQRCANIRPLDPLLEKYESEYHYLFARIYNEAKTSAPVDFEQNFVLPNMARRLLEAFLAFRQPHLAGELWKKMEAIKFDEAKKLRILRFLHTYSHSGSIGEPEYDPSLFGESRSVLTDLLELIKGQDSEHYSAMEKLVYRHDNEGPDE